MSKPIPIYETFNSFQGEGCFAGQRAFFIRTYGCPVQCPWCDSAGTWHPQHKPPAGIKRMTAEELVAQAERENAARVIVTGGEPSVHDLSDLANLLADRGIYSHIETSGGFDIQGTFDWVTVSPKQWKALNPQTVQLANEYKFIIAKPGDILFYRRQVEDAIQSLISRPVFLHPEWSRRHDPGLLNAITAAVKEGERDYRAGYQMHKLFAADSLDPRSAPLVPLGGNINNGF